MRIGIDCIGVDPQYCGGVNTYVFGIIKGFKSQNAGNFSIIIFCTSKNIHLFKEYEKDNLFKIVILNEFTFFIRKLFRIVPYILNSGCLWRKFWNLYTKISGINSKIESECDLLYTPTTLLNVYNLNIPTILSMHDIQHYHFPEFFTNRQLKLLHLAFISSAKSSNYFQVSSQFIKNDLLNYFKFLNKNQLIIIPEGVDVEEFSKKSLINVKLKYNLPERFIFYPAQLWKHKNHISVLRALKKIEEDNNLKIPLVLTGTKYSASKDIFKFIDANEMDNVFYLGRVPFDDLIAIYQNAYLLISASLYESSCLPILEAASTNLPIVASDIPPNKEMSEILKLNLFNPLDISEIKDVILKCWTDLNLIQSQSTYNREHVNIYHWNKCANKYLDFINNK